MHTETSQYYTTTQVARIFAVSPQTVRNWCETGKIIGAVKLPGGSKALWRIPKDSLSLKPHQQKPKPRKVYNSNFEMAIALKEGKL